ncbi:MAG: type II toxin-antitoxin system VapC family toxin [Stellaceae bacterium]
MIAIDTSAVIAILRGEVEAAPFARVIAKADSCFFSAVGLLEASLVMIGRGSPEVGSLVDTLVQDLAIEVVSFDQELARESRAAFIRFGRGRHPAGLNFGDCVSYALAQARGLPLLYKGEDFAKTDVISAIR